MKYEKENLELAIKNSLSKREVLDKLNLRAAGGNYKTLNKYIDKFEIDISHFLTQSERAKQLIIKNIIASQLPLEEVLTVNSTYSRASLKKRLYKEGLKIEQCELCGQGPYWNDKKMSLILDHINGIYNDNRISNLRIVCPNCNATLPTHCGRNIKKHKLCVTCNTAISKKATKCRKCSKKNSQNEKINWPTDQELSKIVWKIPRSKLSKIYGVSDTAISKRCKSRKIKMPPRGYWSKIKRQKK